MDLLTSPQRLAEFDEAIFEASICVADEALLEQKIDAVRRLLECGADPHAGPTDTPIMHSFCGSCCRGFYSDRTLPALKLIDLLVEHGADVNLLDAEGNTALHAACAVGNFEICRALIAKGASVSGQNNEGFTPLDCADRSQGSDKEALIGMLKLVTAATTQVDHQLQQHSAPPTGATEIQHATTELVQSLIRQIQRVTEPQQPSASIEVTEPEQRTAPVVEAPHCSAPVVDAQRAASIEVVEPQHNAPNEVAEPQQQSTKRTKPPHHNTVMTKPQQHSAQVAEAQHSVPIEVTEAQHSTQGTEAQHSTLSQAAETSWVRNAADSIWLRIYEKSSARCGNCAAFKEQCRLAGLGYTCVDCDHDDANRELWSKISAAGLEDQELAFPVVEVSSDSLLIGPTISIETVKSRLEADHCQDLCDDLDSILEHYQVDMLLSTMQDPESDFGFDVLDRVLALETEVGVNEDGEATSVLARVNAVELILYGTTRHGKLLRRIQFLEEAIA